jgi:hypothetical protein
MPTALQGWVGSQGGRKPQHNNVANLHYIILLPLNNPDKYLPLDPPNTPGHQFELKIHVCHYQIVAISI